MSDNYRLATGEMLACFGGQLAGQHRGKIGNRSYLGSDGDLLIEVRGRFFQNAFFIGTGCGNKAEGRVSLTPAFIDLIAVGLPQVNLLRCLLATVWLDRRESHRRPL